MVLAQILPIPAVSAFPFSFHHTVYEFDDLSTAPFDVAEYSRLKFGSASAAKAFARVMADTFFAKHHNLLTERQCVVVAAPSTGVPIASEILSQQFLYRLNHHLSLAGITPAESTVFHRTMVYNNDYATVTAEERKALLASIDIFANRDFIANKLLIFIDDVRITGTHEEKLKSFMLASSLHNPHIFVCLASYIGNDASIENRLNHNYVMGVPQLLELARDPSNKVTTRVAKMILEAKPAEFIEFLDQAPVEFLTTVYNSSILRRYSEHKDYLANFHRLQGFISSKM